MENKQFLDFLGLSLYDEKIKALLKTGDSTAVAQALTLAKAYTDGKIDSLSENLTTVAAALAAEKQLRETADNNLNSALDNFVLKSNLEWGELDVEEEATQ